MHLYHLVIQIIYSPRPSTLKNKVPIICANGETFKYQIVALETCLKLCPPILL